MDGYIRQLKRATRTIEEARIATDPDGEHFDLSDGTIEVFVELTPGGETTWADLSMAMGGASGGLVRVPKPGDSCLVALPAGDVARAHVIGWTASADAMPAPDGVVPDVYFWRARGGEAVRIETTDAAITLTTGGSTFEIRADGKIRLGNEVDVLQVLSDTLDALSQAKTATSIGSQPLINFATFAQLKTDLDTIKGA